MTDRNSREYSEGYGSPNGRNGAYRERDDYARRAGGSHQAPSRPSSGRGGAGNVHSSGRDMGGYGHQAQGYSRSGYESSSNGGARSGSYNPYGREDASRYSRSNYSRSSYGKGGTPKRNGKKTGLFAVLALVLVAGIGFGVFWYYHTLPFDVTINGNVTEVKYHTTFQDLHDQGLLIQPNGDLLAVDGSVLTQGGGDIYQIMNDGELVKDYKSYLKKGDIVTEARGTDTTEASTVVETTVPWTYDIESLGRDDIYATCMGILINPGTNGVDKQETGAISGKTVSSKTSVAMVPYTVRYFYPIDPGDDKKVVALTFDDGPSNYTQQILDTLSRHNAVATFFMLGSNAEEYPDVVQAIVDQGSQPASHGYTHGGGSNPYMSERSDESLKNDISAAQTAINNACGVKTTTIRPSGGYVSDNIWKACEGLVTSVVGWDVDTNDWRKPGASEIVGVAVGEAYNGAVILMHDGGGDRSQTVEALDSILTKLADKGYTFVTIDQLAEYQKAQYLANGE